MNIFKGPNGQIIVDFFLEPNGKIILISFQKYFLGPNGQIRVDFQKKYFLWTPWTNCRGFCLEYFKGLIGQITVDC